jgi:hypothetical protein
MTRRRGAPERVSRSASGAPRLHGGEPTTLDCAGPGDRMAIP